jgi:predicted nucleotidyltransferase
VKYGLKEETIHKIQQVLRKYTEIDRAVLYGSRAKGNFKLGSDIDITLKGQKIEIEILNKIRNDLDELSEPYTMDISIFADIENKDLIDHINRVGVIFYEK